MSATIWIFNGVAWAAITIASWEAGPPLLMARAAMVLLSINCLAIAFDQFAERK